MIITIDGPAGSGKSTAARNVARKLGFIHVNQGALFRAIGLKAVSLGVSVSDEDALARIARETRFEFFPPEGGAHDAYLLVDGRNLSQELQSVEASKLASSVAVLPKLRDVLLEIQRAKTKSCSAVIEGRDAGTVGFPEADLKVYLVASLEVRAKRRFEELGGVSNGFSLEQISKEIMDRDLRDSTRAVAPLSKASDAVEIDTTSLNPDQVVDKIIKLAS